VLDCLAGDVERAVASIAEVNDYECLVRFALRHEVVGEVALFTARAQIELPAAIREGLDSYASRLRDRMRLLRQESVAIMDTLDRMEIPAVVAKGAIWDRLFRDADMPRTSKDLDIYINAEDIRAAVERIVDAYGGVPYDPLNETLENLHHHGFWAPGAGTAVEIHWDLAGPWHNLRFDLPQAISRSRTILLEEGKVRTLRTDDTILFCALELAKDSWASLKKILDFAGAIRNGGEDALVSTEIAARGLGCSRILYASLNLALELRLLGDVDLGGRQVSTDPAVHKIAAVSLRRLTREGRRPSVYHRAVEGVTLSLKHDRRLDRAYHMWRIIILYRLRGWLGFRYR
jgi:hypothetical protein